MTRPALSSGTHQRVTVERENQKQPPPLTPGQSTPLEGANHHEHMTARHSRTPRGYGAKGCRAWVEHTRSR